MKKHTLKKITALILSSILLVTFLASCGAKKSLEEIAPVQSATDENSPRSSDVKTAIDSLCARAAYNSADKASAIPRALTPHSVTLDVNIEDASNEYSDYILNDIEADYLFKSLDYDNDSVKEVVLLINGFGMGSVTSADAQNSSFSLSSYNFGSEDALVIYFDNEGENACRVQACAVKDVSFSDGSTSVNYFNDRLDISYASETEVFHVFLTENEFTDQTAAEQYRDLLEYSHCENITFTTIDISPVPGLEMIFDFDKDGNHYTVFMALDNGNLRVMRTVNDKNKATFVYDDGEISIVEYSKLLGDNYCITVYKFDDNYSYTPVEEMVVDPQTDDATAFFDKLNSYFKNVMVVYDPFILAGEKATMDNGFISFEYTEIFSILNANTDMTAYIDSKTGSFVYLRSGPSKDTDPVCTDPSNEKTFLQLKTDTKVNVEGVVNTADKENPTWIEVTVDYAGESYYGYTSLNYMKTPDAIHIKTGDSFEIKTTGSAHDWYSSHPDVAEVDSNGRITAYTKGAAVIYAEDKNTEIHRCLVVVE